MWGQRCRTTVLCSHFFLGILTELAPIVGGSGSSSRFGVVRDSRFVLALLPGGIAAKAHCGPTALARLVAVACA